MDIQLLTDTIVRQTTVLLAQIATASGMRAPLAHVANQVFLDLAQELESQGVRKKVVADMFGMALRSYQIKVRRLMDSSQVQHSTWRRVFTKLEAGSVTRRQLAIALPTLSSRDLSAVLNDLVDSGLAYSSGNGSGAVYGATTLADRVRLEQAEAEQALANRLWLVLATGDGARTSEALMREAGQASAEAVDAVLKELLLSGRVRAHEQPEGPTSYEALDFHIPVGAEQGWEAAVCDHFAAVSTAVAAKLATPRSRSGDSIGGATLRFRVHPGHPFYEEVASLLTRTRDEVGALWQKVSAHNDAHPPPEEHEVITFYYGQNSNHTQEGTVDISPEPDLEATEHQAS